MFTGVSMVKEIIIKSKSLNGTRGMKAFLNCPTNSIELSIEEISNTPYTLRLKGLGIVGKDMEKDTSAFKIMSYRFLIDTTLKKFRIKKDRDYSLEII